MILGICREFLGWNRNLWVKIDKKALYKYSEKVGSEFRVILGTVLEENFVHFTVSSKTSHFIY